MTNFIFNNHTEAAFYDYLLTRQYRRSTARDYIRRLRRIDDVDVLLHQPVERLISDYKIGSKMNVNARCHGAYAAALGRFQEFRKEKGII